MNVLDVVLLAIVAGLLNGFQCKSDNIDLGGNAFCSYCGARRTSVEGSLRAGSSGYLEGSLGQGKGRDTNYYGPRGAKDELGRNRHDERGARDWQDREHEPSKKFLRRGNDRSVPGAFVVEWPPPFESNGDFYVFDPRCGMFYEARSNFFFDPKTKLYYGNKKGSYFRYVPGSNPAFQIVQQQSSNHDGEGGTQESAAQNFGDLTNESDSSVPSERVPSSASNKKITISIGKNGFGIGNKVDKGMKDHPGVIEVGTIGRKVSPDQEESAASSVSNRHAADIDKWSKKSKEQVQHAEDAASSSNFSLPLQSSSGHGHSTLNSKVTAGNPVCLLCKRKFLSVEKLREHEEKSALHKQNLRRAEVSNEESASDNGSVTQEYRDRAKERRAIFGTDSNRARGGNRKDNTNSHNPPSPETRAPEENLGDSNVGNQLLQKLGWKKGSALGRKEEASSTVSGMSNNLKQDWKRIEVIAQGSNTHRDRRGPAGGGVGSV